MKKMFSLVAVLIISLFVLPFGNTALADGKTYDDIKDGEYDITAKALKADSDDNSGAASFIKGEATLIVKDGQFELKLTIPHNDTAEVTGLQVEGIVPTIDGEKWTYKLNQLKSTLTAKVQYEVPSMNMKGDEPFRFVLEGLDDLPKEPHEGESEPKDPEEAPEERVVGDLVTEDEADAVYELSYETDSKATAAQLKSPVKLLKKNGKKYIQIPINEDGAQYFRSLQINGKEVVWNSITEGPYTIQFELQGELEDTLDLSMVIQAGPKAMAHDGIDVWFDTDSIKTIKEKSEPKDPEEAPEERVVGNLVTEDEADAVYELNYETDSKSTAAQLKNPVKLLKKNGKKYIQIPINEDGAQYFRSLQINGKEVVWNSITEGPYTIQFELQGELENTLDLSMVIQAGPKAMAHDDIELRFNTDSIKTIKEKSEKEDSEHDIIKDADETHEIEYITDSSSTQRQFNNPVTLLIKDGKKYIQMSGTGGQFIKSLSVNGTEVNWVKRNDDGTFVIQFALPGALSDEIDFGMTIAPPGMDDMEHTVSLSFERLKQDEPKQDDPKKENPKEEAEKKPKQEPKAEDLVTPDKAYEIGYVIKHATKDEVSAADTFFKGPGILLEKGGNKYLQLTVDSWEWIKYIKTKHGDVDVVKLNKDGSAVIQFKIDGNLANPIILDMHIVVPKEVAGMEYDMKHSARLFLDSKSMKQIDASGFELVVDPVKKGGSNDDDSGKTPAKPTFGTNGDTTDNGVTPNKGDNTNNPKTGDTSNIILFSLLLIGSLIPLAIQYRKKRIA